METSVDLEALKRGDEGMWNQFFLEFDPLIRSVVAHEFVGPIEGADP